MKLIRSGGVNDKLNSNDPQYTTYGFGNFFMSQIKLDLDKLTQQNLPIALCTAAKQNKYHYNQWLTDIGFNMNDFTILGSDDTAHWEEYAAILLLGGETKSLYTWLKQTKFSLNALKKCQLLGGDSAGAYVLSAKTLIDYSPDGELVEIVDGFLPEYNQLIVAHGNNSYYCRPELSRKLKRWCSAHDVEFVELAENEIDMRKVASEDLT